MRFHVRKPHLDFFAFPTRLFVSLCLGQCASNIAGILMQIAGEFAAQACWGYIAV